MAGQITCLCHIPWQCYVYFSPATSDYAPVDTVVVFPEGSTSGDMQCVNVTILDDDVIEGTEIFTLQATTVGATSLIIIDPSLSLTTVSIADSESKP